ncbi:unnamed protein product [Meloidogyne enterolobii]|uniref:Uncharacterized protein n=1 Tax=Meloidogyne enterolobii TaxID=390850 RepID=A0ACB1AKV6_MELEN
MSESERTRPRPSPRWREPLVDEYINVGDQTTSSETRDFETRAKTITTINGEENKTFPENVSGKYNYNGLEKEKEEEERSWERKSWTKQERTTTRDGLEEEEERPFFSEEFYQAFPHLRPSTKTTFISTNQTRPFVTSPSSTSDPPPKRFSEARACEKFNKKI